MSSAPMIGPPTVAGVPTLPGGFLSRQRLLSTLDAATDARLIVLRGPGGAGKSTLVADWLRRGDAGDAQVAWLSLDHGSGSRSAFWRRVAGVLSRNGVLSSSTSLVEAEPGPADEHRLRALIVDELGDGPPVRLVIDDFHEADPALAEDIAWVLERSPRLQAVVSTRRRERFEDAVVRVRLDVAVITTEELAFTAEESAQVVRQSSVWSDPRLVEAIHDATLGHPLAVRLAITALEAHPHDDDLVQLTRFVVDQTARDFMPLFSDESRRDAAIRLSIAPYVDQELAAALTGREDAGSLMAEFEREGIGSRRVEHNAWWFSFHPLVAQALRQELSHLDRSELAGLRMRAAEFLEGSGDPIAATEQLLAAEQYDAVWPLVTRNFSELWNHFSVDLEAALTVVPRVTLRRHPTLAVSLLVIRAHREGVPSTLTRALADEALVSLRNRLESSAPEERFLLLAAILGAYRSVRRYAEAADAAEALLSMIDRLPPDLGRRAVATIEVVLVQIALGSMLNGRLADALAAAQRVSLDSPWRAVHALSLAALVATIQGETLEARAIGGQLAALTRPRNWRGSYGAVGWHVAEAVTSLDRFDPQRAGEGLGELAATLDLVDLWPYPVWARALGHLVVGDAERGAQELIELRAAHSSRPASDHARDLLTGVHADLLLAAGQPARARRVLGRQRHASPPVMLARARLDLAEGAPERVIAALAPTGWDETWTSRQRSESHLLRAVAYVRLGLPDEGRADLQRALDMMTRTEAHLPLAMAPHDELLTLLPDDEAARVLIESAPEPFAEPLRATHLTPRERDVLAAIASAASLEAVAAELFVSPNTVKTQLRAAYRKLGVSSRADAVRVARRRGLLDD